MLNPVFMYSPCILPPALQRLRGWEEVDEELSEMRLENQSERAEGRLSVVSLLSQASLRWQLVSIVVMNMGQQLSGVNAVRLPARDGPPPAPDALCVKGHGATLVHFLLLNTRVCFVSSESSDRCLPAGL